MADTSEPIYFDDLTDLTDLADLADLADAVGPGLLKPSHAKRAVHVVRIGRFVLSPIAIAWITSITVHGVVFAAGVWIVTTLVHHAHFPDWGGGGGSSGGLVAGETRSQIADRSLPGLTPAPVELGNRQPGEVSAVDVEFQGAQKTSIDLTGDLRGNVALIGATATSSVGQPHFDARRPWPTGVGGSTGNRQAASASDIRSTVDSAPDLPGALLGSGPPAPDYPVESKRLGEQGTVRVAIEVLPDGGIGQIHVISDPGFPRLRDASMKAAEQLRRYQLNPAIKGGKRTREFIVIPYNFKLR